MYVWGVIDMKVLRFLGSSMLLLVGIALAIGAVFTSPRVHFFIYSSHYSDLYRVSLGFLALVILILYIGFKIRLLRASTVRPNLFQLPPGLAVALQKRVGQTRTVTPRDAQIFALAITNPALSRPRIREIYEPSRRTIKQDVTVDIQLPRALFNPCTDSTRQSHAAQAPVHEIGPITAQENVVNEALEVPETLLVPFPVVVPIKGELTDELEVYGLDDDHLTTYSYSEYLELVAGVLRMLLLKSCYSDENGSLHSAITKAETKALRCIMRRGLQSPDDVTKTVDCILSLKSLNISADPQHARHPDKQLVSLVAELVRQLANRYAVVALIECNSDYRSLIHYTRTIVPGLRLSKINGHCWKWAKERLSILFGARPVSLRIPLTTAATCQSYHLVARCPEGLFLSHQQFHGLEGYLQAEAARREALRRAGKPVPLPPPHYHARSRLGQPYAHFYSRYFVETADITSADKDGPAFSPQREFPSAEFTFDEVPPGSLFRGVLAAFSASALIWIVGFIVSKNLDPGTDAPAVLLAFPAVVAGWLGVDAMPRRLIEGTLTARLSLAATAAFALAGSALFMIYYAKVPILHGRIPFPVSISILGINQGSWGVLLALSFINTAYVAYRWFRHTWEYKWLCARPGLVENAIEGS